MNDTPPEAKDLLTAFQDDAEHASRVRFAAWWGFFAIGVPIFLAYIACWTFVAYNIATLKTEVALTLTAVSSLVLVVALICGTVLCRTVTMARTERDVGRIEAFASVLRATTRVKGRDDSMP